jgi:hypothetical protein
MAICVDCNQENDHRGVVLGRGRAPRRCPVREQTSRLITAMLAATGTLVGAMGIFVALAEP